MTLRLLAISGSLRAASHNSALLRALARLAPPDIEITLYAGMSSLPLFNPDIEATDPKSVAELRKRIIAAEGLIIASPEYAHGVTGVIKNALDWMVGNESFVNKPVMLLNASPRAAIAPAALRVTIETMSARVVDDASITVPILGSGLDEDGIVSHPEISAALLRALRAFHQSIRLIQFAQL
jgi:chromate reductase